MFRLNAILLLAVTVLRAEAFASDPIARLGEAIESGRIQVRFADDGGYLPWLLETLQIPVESQMMVFSKTGIQAIRTEPANPRRIYFNDSVFVATVKGGPVEIIAQDPQQGMVFYLLEQSAFRYREFKAKPKPISPFAKRVDCVHCHASPAKSNAGGGIAVTLIRSVVTDGSGIPLDRFASRDTDSRTPFDQLWGGWFVTGKSTGKHMGNTVMGADGKPRPVTSPGTSDVAALLVFEHQTRIMNLIARVKFSGEGVDELSRAIVFEDDAPLPEPVQGESGFAEKFAALGPLRELDLKTRLTRYSCSYMIYSDAFQALPASLKAAVYRHIASLKDSNVNRILDKTLKGFSSIRQLAGFQ